MARFSNCSINGQTFSGNSITVINGRVIVDGVDLTPDAKTITIEVTGDVDTLQVDNCDRITVGGSVQDLETVNGDVTVEGGVTGDIETVNGNVTCGTVGGKVKTVNGNIKHL